MATAYHPRFTPAPTQGWLTYIGECDRCQKQLRESDHRIRSLDDLRNFGIDREHKLYCNSCLDKSGVQTVEVGTFRNKRPVWHTTLVSNFDLGRLDDYVLQAT